MILLADIAVTTLIIYFVGNFFAKLIAEKVFKKELSKGVRTALFVIYFVLAVLCFLPDILKH